MNEGRKSAPIRMADVRTEASREVTGEQLMPEDAREDQPDETLEFFVSATVKQKGPMLGK